MSDRTRQDAELAASTRRWMRVGLVLMLLLTAAFPAYRVYEPAQRAEARETQQMSLADEGGQLFETTCAGCHGSNGRGALAPGIGSANFLNSVTDNQIEQLTALGVPGSEMVAYSIDYGGSLTSAEIRSIAAFLRSLEEDAETNPIWRTPLANEDFLGGDLFNLACSRCHGIDRKGIEDLAPDISADSITMEESDEFIGRRIRDGYKEMPKFGGVLTDVQVAQIVDFLRGGTGEVPTTTTTTTAAPPEGTTTTEPESGGADPAVLALGKEIFEVTGGGDGCAECHGLEATGTPNGPNIIGASKSSLVGALGGGVLDMADFGLSQDEIDAVYAYLVTLNPNN